MKEEEFMNIARAINDNLDCFSCFINKDANGKEEFKLIFQTMFEDKHLAKVYTIESHEDKILKRLAQ